ncbi:MAG TPA: ABC transporter substrate-binding protein [Pyrinomonadaceae bacterium]|nr:ABC transporter substrate-binding protein [Pyrinomonadaceae bacterium]
MTKIIVSLLLMTFVLLAGVLAEAQQPAKVWHLGVFHVGLDHVPPSLETLRGGLKALGYEQGKNIYLDWRNLGDEEAARESAKEFVRNRVDLIVAFENQSVRAAKAATTEIPIVFISVTDPVADGFVKSLAHPGGNLTGFVGRRELPDKELELFKEVVPRLRRVLVLSDPEDPAAERLLIEVRKIKSVLKLQLIERAVTSQGDIERVFNSIKRSDVEGVLMVSIDLQQKFTALILRLASEKRLPLAVRSSLWVEKGGLFSYGHDVTPVGRDAAGYVDRILKGTKPADLPVQQPMKFELIINLKTAKQIGIEIPQWTLMKADKVIR